MSFRIIRNDITRVSADAIVNTANSEPTYGDGTDAAIYAAAGAEELLEERRRIGEIGTGEAAATPAFALDAKYIIHTVGPAWIDGEHGEREAVRRCYENSLKLARELSCESIAFPLIATGVYGFPRDEALQIAVSVFSSFLSSADMEITLVVFDPKSFVLSGRIFSGIDSYIDENYVAEQTKTEYFGAAAASAMSMASAAGPGLDMAFEQNGPTAFGAASPLADRAVSPKKKEKRSRRSLFRKRDAQDTVCFDAAAFDEDAEEWRCEEIQAPQPMSTGGKKRSLEDAVANIGESFHDMLFRLIDERGYKDSEVYKRANIDRKLFSKIRSSAQYRPRKNTVVALALALRLNLDETKEFLGRAGYAFSPGSVFDLIIEYFIENEVFDIYQINLALFDHTQECLGE